eukprot:203077-Chlamydomonas_euryale.AAC.1
MASQTRAPCAVVMAHMAGDGTPRWHAEKYPGHQKRFRVWGFRVQAGDGMLRNTLVKKKPAVRSSRERPWPITHRRGPVSAPSAPRQRPVSVPSTCSIGILVPGIPMTRCPPGRASPPEAAP